MKVKIIELKQQPPYVRCEGCSNRAKYRIIIKYGQGEKEKDIIDVCKIHFRQSVLMCEKFLKAAKRFRK